MRDPLVIDPKTPAPVLSHEDRLKMCSMQIKCESKLSPEDSSLLHNRDGAQMRVLCHGSALSIDWNAVDPKHQPSSPADVAQIAICKSHPIAVGTNSIDALLDWMRVSMGCATAIVKFNLDSTKTTLLTSKSEGTGQYLDA
jgi:hypothetical protein